jgi:hypothetical protein
MNAAGVTIDHQTPPYCSDWCLWNCIRFGTAIRTGPAAFLTPNLKRGMAMKTMSVDGKAITIRASKEEAVKAQAAYNIVMQAALISG